MENNTIKSESKGEEKIIHKGTNEKESKEKNENVSKVKSEGGQDWSKFENSDLVLHISDSNFKKITREHDFLLILFYKDGISFVRYFILCDYCTYLLAFFIL